LIEVKTGIKAVTSLEKMMSEQTGSQVNVETFFHEPTFTATHVVWDPGTRHAAVIDSVLDYDHKSGRTSTPAADGLIDFVRQQKLCVDWILETHAHADHVTAAPYLQDKLGGEVAIGANITAVQDAFKTIFNLEPTFPVDGSQFDRLLDDGETLNLGDQTIRVMHTPGHTPACVSYLIGDAAFVGDTIFMPDYGTARVDFPGGDAATLYQSIHKLFALPNDMRLFLCHDYKAPDRDEFVWETTVGAEKKCNIQVHEPVSEAEFVEMRTKRDATLDMPTLILPSIQMNIRAGSLPPAEANGIRYLKLPLNAL
jgi:glyoxylase-like metal-dependent hydrolase (beta-lactamase superfamily II)